MGKDPLDKLRDEINSIDSDILNLLKKRLSVTKKVGEYKHKKGLPVFVAEREKLVIEKILKKGKDLFPKKSLEYIYREIIAACRDSEEKQRISFLGPAGTFTHVASIRIFGNSSNFIPRPDIGEIFEDVEKGRSDFGVVPVENSLQGTVTYVLDLFLEYELKIIGELYLSIEHNLYSLEDDISKIKKIYSHQQALAQCRGWIKKYLPGVSVIESYSTAEAAKIVSEERGAAAICTDWAGTMYGLKLLEKGIQDVAVNVTRFFIISKYGNSHTEETKYKTSLSIIVKDEPGSLFSTLSPFAKYKVNMTKIESRPLKGKGWEYVFFIDIEGHYSDKNILKTLEEVKKHTAKIDILGSYPKIMEENDD